MEQQIEIIGTPSFDISYYFDRIVHFVFSIAGQEGNIAQLFQQFVGLVVGISIPIAIFFLIAIVITVENLKKIRTVEEERYLKPPVNVTAEVKVENEQARRWRKVMEHINSENPNDWKQAIIEADIMLDQLLDKLGYRGESIGEKLKRTTKGDFKTRDQAWQAHLVRNRIAHDGSEFDLNHLVAKQTIGLYRLVFEEFYHIVEK